MSKMILKAKVFYLRREEDRVCDRRIVWWKTMDGRIDGLKAMKVRGWEGKIKNSNEWKRHINEGEAYQGLWRRVYYMLLFC